MMLPVDATWSTGSVTLTFLSGPRPNTNQWRKDQKAQRVRERGRRQTSLMQLGSALFMSPHECRTLLYSLAPAEINSKNVALGLRSHTLIARGRSVHNPKWHDVQEDLLLDAWGDIEKRLIWMDAHLLADSNRTRRRRAWLLDWRTAIEVELGRRF